MKIFRNISILVFVIGLSFQAISQTTVQKDLNHSSIEALTEAEMKQKGFDLEGTNIEGGKYYVIEFDKKVQAPFFIIKGEQKVKAENAQVLTDGKTVVIPEDDILPVTAAKGGFAISGRGGVD